VTTSDALLVAAAVFAALAAFAGFAGVASLRRLRLVRGGAGLLVSLLLLSIAALAATLTAGLQGYRALTREELAAVVTTRPTGPQRFEARFVFPDGRDRRFQLSGDQFVVEARILKWHPWANWLGLHTAYELDRVTGRYRSLEDERAAPRSVFPLGDPRRIDLFEWRQRLPWLAPFVDAEYGSATFTEVGEGARFEVRVSTTGLLVRRVE
jgi:hypothetical protein